MASPIAWKLESGRARRRKSFISEVGRVSRSFGSRSKKSHADVAEDLKDEFDGGNRPLTLRTCGVCRK